MAGGEAMQTLEELIKELPPELRQEVHDFVCFLLEREAQPKQEKLRMTWAGGLREFRDQFASLELQRRLSNGEVTDASYRYQCQN